MNTNDARGEKCRQSSSGSSGENLSASLHIKLGLMKIFVKGIDKTGRVRNESPNVSAAKIKEGIFIGSQIRQLIQGKQFNEDLNETERNAWLSFKRICKGFLGNHKAPRKYQDVCAGPVDFVPSYRMQHESENPLSEVTLEFFPR